VATTAATPDPAEPAADRAAARRVLWLAAYVVAVLAPVALMAVAVKPGDDSFAVIAAAGLGFAAFAILALQVVMPSRAASFSAPFGVDLLVRFHRQMAYVALALVVGHVALLVIEDPGRWSLLNPAEAPFRGVAATISLVALVALILSSSHRERLRLRYEGWRGIHIALGVAVIVFAFLHLLGVSAYLEEPVFRWAALAFAVAALGAVFHLRVGRQFTAARRPFAVDAVEQERGGAATVWLRPLRGGVRFRPGQFAWLKRADAPYRLAENPFSFSSSALDSDRVAFTAQEVGDFTRALRELEPGERILIDGPHGSFAPGDPEAGFVLIAAGIGITPMVSLLRTMADQGDERPVTLVYGSREWEETTFRDELESLSSRLDLEVVHALTKPPRGWKGERGRVDGEVLSRALSPGSVFRNHLICGPPEMVETCAAALRQMGVRSSLIHTESFETV
jgi:predicted ferric reductase